MKRTVVLLAFVMFLVTSLKAMALVIPWTEGKWPVDWPTALEPLRKQATTLDVGTGTQEHIYTIPFGDREGFEKYWPILMTVRTPGSPLTLSKIGTVHAGWGDLISNAKPCVRIKGPSGGISGKREFTKDEMNNIPKLIEQGLMARAAPPWPKEITGPDGELPEYVTLIDAGNGNVAWTTIDEVPEKNRGFHHRARVDIELVIDGDVIDLNRIALPEGAPIIDRRFRSPSE